MKKLSRRIAAIKEDYMSSRSNAYESFAEWHLKRVLGFRGKMLFAYGLWGPFFYLLLDPRRMLYLFYLALILAVLVIFIEAIGKWRK